MSTRGKDVLPSDKKKKVELKKIDTTMTRGFTQILYDQSPKAELAAEAAARKKAQEAEAAARKKAQEEEDAATPPVESDSPQAEEGKEAKRPKTP